MKKMFSVMLLVVSLLAACNNPKSDEPQKKGSSGKTLELMIVADKDVYRGETKELIDSLFARPQIGLPVPEKMFDIVNIPVSSYKNTEMFRNHRNIIYCDVNPTTPTRSTCILTSMPLPKWCSILLLRTKPPCATCCASMSITSSIRYTVPSIAA